MSLRSMRLLWSAYDRCSSPNKGHGEVGTRAGAGLSVLTSGAKFISLPLGVKPPRMTRRSPPSSSSEQVRQAHHAAPHRELPEVNAQVSGEEEGDPVFDRGRGVLRVGVGRWLSQPFGCGL